MLNHITSDSCPYCFTHPFQNRIMRSKPYLLYKLIYNVLEYCIRNSKYEKYIILKILHKQTHCHLVDLENGLLGLMKVNIFLFTSSHMPNLYTYFRVFCFICGLILNCSYIFMKSKMSNGKYIMILFYDLTPVNIGYQNCPVG